MAALFNIRSGEERVVFLLVCFAALIGIPRIFTPSVSQSIFLSRYDAQSLPYVYMGVAATTTAIGLLYLRLERILAFSRLLFANFVLLLFALFCFRLVLLPQAARWPAMAMAIWYEVEWSLTDLAFWALVGRLLDVRQGKRLFALIGSGEMLSGIICGFSVPCLVARMGTVNLLWISMGGILCALILVYRLKQVYPEKFQAETRTDGDESTPKEDKRASFAAIMKSRYIVMLFVMTLCCIMVDFISDNAFYDVASARYPHTDRLAAFLGTFMGLGSLFALVIGTVLSGRLINRFGLLFALLAVPVAMAAGLSGVVIAAFFMGPPALVFFIMAAARIAFRSLWSGTYRPGTLILYQPLSPDNRVRVQIVTENIACPLFIGGTGLFLLLLNKGLNFRAPGLCAVMLGILAVWFLCVFRLRIEYNSLLTSALSRRSLPGHDLSLADGSSLLVLKKSLESPHTGEVLHALNMLEEIEHDSLDDFLANLLAHPEPDVRSDVLGRIEKRHVLPVRPRIEQMIDSETDPEVRGRVIRTFATLGTGDDLDRILPYLKDPEPEVRLGAMVGLLRSGGIEGVLLAGEDLLECIRSNAEDERAFGAKVLGEVGIRSFTRPLFSLIQDPSPKVARCALDSAARLKNPLLWPLVARRLSDPAVRAVAFSVLDRGGAFTLTALFAEYDKEGQKPDVCYRILRLMGGIQKDECIEFLLDKLDVEDRTVSFEAMRSLQRLGYNAPEEMKQKIHGKIREEAGDAAWIHAACRDIKDEDANDLKKTLSETLLRVRERIFLLLSHVHDPDLILRARENLVIGSPEKRAYALEFLDNTLSRDLKGLLFPLLEHYARSDGQSRLFNRFPQPFIEAPERIKDIFLKASDWHLPWLCAASIRLMGKYPGDRFTESCIMALDNPESYVRETACATLAAIDRKTLEGQKQRLLFDPAPMVRKAASYCLQETPSEKKALLTVEKVHVLSSVSIFSKTPAHVLARIAGISREESVPKGRVLIREHDEGDFMFIIVDGLVHVYKQTRGLVNLGKGQIVGGFDILDREPRTASVRSLRPSILLRLDREPLFDLISGRTEVALGVIRALCERVRESLAISHNLTGNTPPGEGIQKDPARTVSQADQRSSAILNKTDPKKLLVIEKVILLKMATLFAHTPHPILAEISALLKEETFSKGETIIAKGDIGDCMYSIYDGLVRVHDEKRVLTRLGERAFFGELSVLDSEPRSASVTAEEETHLFRLSQRDLYQIMESRPEVAGAVIQGLTRWIKSIKVE